MPTLISLNFQVYQAPESVMMTQRVHYFLDLGQSYFYRIKGMSWITAEYLQWTIYVKTKSNVYMYIARATEPLQVDSFLSTIQFPGFQEFLVLNWWPSEGWKAESDLEPPSGFELGTPELGTQCLKH